MRLNAEHDRVHDRVDMNQFLDTFDRVAHSAIVTFANGEKRRIDVWVDKKEIRFWDRLEEKIMNDLNSKLQNKIVKLHLMRN